MPPGLFASTGHQTLAIVALVAALLHVVFHAVFKGSLFLSASSVQQATGSTDLDELGGLLQRMPVSGPIFLVGGLAIAALPPFCGFVSEWLLLQSMLHGLPSTDVTIAVAMPVGVGVLALTGGLHCLHVRQGNRHRPARASPHRTRRSGQRSPPLHVDGRRSARPRSASSSG